LAVAPPRSTSETTVRRRSSEAAHAAAAAAQRFDRHSFEEHVSFLEPYPNARASTVSAGRCSARTATGTATTATRARPNSSLRGERINGTSINATPLHRLYAGAATTTASAGQAVHAGNTIAGNVSIRAQAAGSVLARGSVASVTTCAARLIADSAGCRIEPLR